MAKNTKNNDEQQSTEVKVCADENNCDVDKNAVCTVRPVQKRNHGAKRRKNTAAIRRGRRDDKNVAQPG